MTPTEKALKTWYPIDHLLHNDPLHPAIGLAGEAGEILDLYKKERFKDGFSWWDCVCGHRKHSRVCNAEIHNDNLWAWADNEIYCACEIYTPKILDELGDLWFYLRILAYQFKLPLDIPVLQNMRSETLTILSLISSYSAKLLDTIAIRGNKESAPAFLGHINFELHRLLRELDCTLDQLTELNWAKLKDGDNHGWQKTLEG